MFRSAISFDNVGTTAAGILMPNITGDSHDDTDDSFVITLRALLSGKMNDGDVLNFEIRKLTGLDESSLKQAEIGCPDNFTIVHVNSGLFRGGAFIESIRRVLPEAHNGYVRQDKVSLFFRSVTNDQIGVVAYINEQTKSVVVFVNRLGLREYHLIQATIPVLMPWYFDVKSGEVVLGDEDKKIIRALAKKEADDYKKAIIDVFDKIAAAHGIRVTCPACNKRGLKPVHGGNYFCRKCFTLFNSDESGQLAEVKSGL